MAFNSEIKGYMTFGKSFSRGAAFPLEAYEIWTDYDALVAYAANTDPNKDPSYIGQKVAYVDTANNRVVHYGIEIDGTLKELGAAPIGDEKSIVIGENNTISLKGVNALVFERDIVGEDGEPTGEKEEVQYQPLMTKEGLVWVEPSKTTVEGLATLIDALTVRVKALEDDRVTEEELADAIAGVEAKIAEVDFVDEGELATALAPYAKTADVNKTLEDYAKTADVEGALADKADKSALEELQGTVDAFLTGDGTEAALDSLKELIAYIDSHDDVDIAGILEDIEGIENKLVGIGGEEEPATVVAAINAAIEALKIGDYAKAADLTALAGRVEALEAKPFDTYATKEELEAHKTEAANTYATKEALAEHVEAFEAYQETANGNFATKTELKATDDIAKDAQNRVGIVEGKIDEITSVGGEPNVIEKIKVNGVTLEVEKDAEGKSTKTVSISVPTSITTLDGYSDLNTRVTNNTNNIAALEGQLGTTNTNVSGLTERLAALEEEVGAVAESRIDALEGAVDALEETVGEHTASITALGVEDARLAGLIGGNTTNITNLLTKVDTGDKTVAEYVADQIAAIKPYDDTAVKQLIADEATTARAAEKANADAIAAIYKVDGETVSGVLADEIARAKAAEQDLDDAIKLLTNGAGTDEIDSVKELIDYVNAHGATVSGINERLDGHDAILAGFGGENEPAAVKAYVDGAIAAIPQYELPMATATTLGGVKSAADVEGNAAINKVYVGEDGVGEVKAFSTDNLVQGNMTLVLNGGNVDLGTN